MKIGVIGTGWLGTPLLQKFKKNRHTCTGTRLSLSNHKDNIIQYQLGETIPKQIYASETILISIPPGFRRKTEDQKKKILTLHEDLLAQINEKTYLIYTSSTSVYKAVGILNEESACDGPLHSIEDCIRKKFTNHLILRLGGLAGPNRRIVDRLAKKNLLDGYNLPTNLLHLEDAVNGIYTACTQKLTGTYNLCCPEHPDKWQVYNKWADDADFKELIKGNYSEQSKVITSQKFIIKTGFIFKYNSPLNFIF